jgi:DNA polymerase elongation subunit (family B)
MKKIWVWDLETLRNIFTATFIDKDSNEIRTFVISNNKNQKKEFFDFINNEVAGLIGYNSLYFDAQVLEYMYRFPDCNHEDIALYSQIITGDNNRKPDVPEWKLRHKHLDLFKALSLSTMAKRTGLKWCEFMMDLDNIEDMPSQGEGNNWEEMVLSYNLNDVIATKELYQRYYHEIDLRKKLTERENINLLNCTEPDLAKRLFSKYLSKAMNISPNDLRTLSTKRDVVNVKDIIFPYVEFKTEKFKTVLNEFKKLSLKEDDKFEFVVNQDIDITYALGGIHAAPNNVVVESDDNYTIKSLDVISYYPNLAIRNGICAEHLPKKIFLDLYEGFFNERKSIPKSDPRNYILKILLNSAYGLSNDKYSFLRDRQVTLSICINGQLLLTQLMEDIILQIPEAQLIMMNTDGFEVKIPKAFVSIYGNICDKWEKLTNLQLEFVDYKRMIISDVNY